MTLFHATTYIKDKSLIGKIDNSYLNNNDDAHKDKGDDVLKGNTIRTARETNEYKMNSTCIRPNWLEKAIEWLKEEGIALPKISVVIGFPDRQYNYEAEGLDKTLKLVGGKSLDTKLSEARTSIETLTKDQEVDIELDPVINVAEPDKPDFGQRVKGEVSKYLQLAIEFKNKFKDNVLSLKPIFSVELLIKKAEAIGKKGEEVYEFLDKAVEGLVRAVKEFTDNQEEFGNILVSFKNSTGMISGPDMRKGGYRAGTDQSLMKLISKTLDKWEDKVGLRKGTIGIKAAGGIGDAATATAIEEDAPSRLSHIGASKGAQISDAI